MRVNGNCSLVSGDRSGAGGADALKGAYRVASDGLTHLVAESERSTYDSREQGRSGAGELGYAPHWLTVAII